MGKVLSVTVKTKRTRVVNYLNNLKSISVYIYIYISNGNT
jgi:hypothetical protein